MELGGTIKLRTFRSHKTVEAAKITKIVFDSELAKETGRETDGSAFLTLEEPVCVIRVSDEYVWKHKPKIGGYYVKYQDGYESWSPSEAFEQGYTPL